MKLTATTVMGLLKKAHSNKDRQNREEDDKVLKLGKQRTKRTYCNLLGTMPVYGHCLSLLP